MRKLLTIAVLLFFGWAVYGVVDDYEEAGLSFEEMKSFVSGVADEAIDTTVTIAQGDPITIGEQEEVIVTSNAVTTTEQLAGAFYAHLSNWDTKFTIEFEGDTTTLGTMLDEAYENAKTSNGYVLGHLEKMNLTYEYTSTRATITVLQSYLTDAHQEQFVDAQVRQILPTIVHDAMTEKEKVLAVNDFIVRQTVYGTATNASPHSAFAVLMEGQAVCQGYALLAYKMIDLLDIDVLYVTGEAGGVGHAWNLVYVDNTWQHLDTTWNDPVPDRGDKVSHAYAFLTDEELLQTHTWVRADYPQAL